MDYKLRPGYIPGESFASYALRHSALQPWHRERLEAVVANEIASADAKTWTCPQCKRLLDNWPVFIHKCEAQLELFPTRKNEH